MNESFRVKSWDWEVTRRCNLKCLHCLLDKTRCGELGAIEALNAVSVIAGMGGETLRLTGGEPLKRSDLGRIIKKAAGLNLRVELITNGLLIDEHFLRESGRHLQHIAVSIDGQEEIHDRIRGNGAYKRAINALGLIMDHSIDASVYITVHSLNEESVSGLVHDILNLGIRKLHLNEINPDGSARENSYLLLDKAHPEERSAKIIAQLGSCIKVDKSRVTADTSCAISPEIAYLGCDGAVYACAEFAVLAPWQRIGHVLESGLKGKFGSYFKEVCSRIPQECRYHSFTMPGVGMCLNRHDACPLIEEVKDESVSA